MTYYNFDVQPVQSVPIYALFEEGEDAPIEGQLNIIDVIPGSSGYNDFWHVHRVTVPTDYVANTVTSASEIMDAGYDIEPTNLIVNCPVVPEGSTADLRMDGGDSGLTRGWYRGEVVYYFEFAEAMFMIDACLALRILVHACWAGVDLRGDGWISVAPSLSTSRTDLRARWPGRRERGTLFGRRLALPGPGG